MGTIPDGVYDIDEEGWLLIDRLPTSKHVLLQAANIIQDELRSGEPDLDRVERKLEEANQAEVAAILRVLRDQATGNAVAALALIAMILQMVFSRAG